MVDENERARKRIEPLNQFSQCPERPRIGQMTRQDDHHRHARLIFLVGEVIHRRGGMLRFRNRSRIGQKSRIDTFDGSPVPQRIKTTLDDRVDQMKCIQLLVGLDGDA